MTNKEKNNSDIKQEITFLNEKIVKYRKQDIIRLVLLIVVCAVIFGSVACITFVCLKPHFYDFLEGKVKEDDSVFWDNENDIITETIIEDTVSNDDSQQFMEGIISQDMPEESVVCVVSNANSNWLRSVSDNTSITSGLVVYKEKSIYILTYYEKVAGQEEVLIYFDESVGYKGKIKNVLEEYRLALIEVDIKQVPEDKLKKIRPVKILPSRKLNVGEIITYIGNPLGRKELITKGSLTLVGNTVSIMDTAICINSTDIVQTGENNGFIFDEKGYIIGMVVDDKEMSSDNIISFVDINSILPYIENMKEDKKTKFIGIYGKEVTDDVIKNIDSDMPYGIYISGIKDESPAYNSGIVGGDVLVMINNQEIHNFEDYGRILYNCDVGQEISIVVMRKGKEGYKKIEYKVMVNGL